MYVPQAFDERDAQRVAQLIGQVGLGMLVSTLDDRPYASHLPMLFEPQAGGHGRLLGHLARANPHYRALAEAPEVLVIFQGPHAYVSPSWYQSPGVPTWNYAVVHLYGRVRLFEEPDVLRALLDRQTRVYEGGPLPAGTPQLPPERREALLGQIAGFEIAISEVQAKFKLSQNRPVADRAGVMAALLADGPGAAPGVVDLMRQNQD